MKGLAVRIRYACRNRSCARQRVVTGARTCPVCGWSTALATIRTIKTRT